VDYSFFPGCALEASCPHYYKSTRATCEALGITLTEVEDWNCCGATAYIGTDEDKAIAYSARNLALAEAAGATDLVTACNACYITLRKAGKCYRESKPIRDNVSRALSAAGLAYRGTVDVRHIAEVFLNDVGTDRIAAAVKRDLGGLKVAAYHGCLLSRPFTDVDDADHPTILDKLLSAAGAHLVPFPMTAKCCGGMLMTTRRDVSLPLVHDILSCARAYGADCVAVACPLCSINLEAYQESLRVQFDFGPPMPIVLFTQLIGSALGISEEALGLEQCFVDVRPALAAYA